jgi:hypothetical protein
VLAQEAEARGKAIVDTARTFAHEKGLSRDAEATARYNAAVPLATELYTEKTGFAPDDIRKPMDAALWKECLVAADAAEVEAGRAARAHAFHQQLLGTDFSEGYTINGVKQDPRDLGAPVLDERKVVARAAMKHSSGEEIRRAMAATESTDVQEALKAGRPR